MRRVIVESPYAGNVKANLEYLRRAMKDCFNRGEAPFASHMLYTQVLDDAKPEERELGIEAGLVWGFAAHSSVVYIDRGFSKGMGVGVIQAMREGRGICIRSLNMTPAEQEIRAREYFNAVQGIVKKFQGQAGMLEEIVKVARGFFGEPS